MPVLTTAFKHFPTPVNLVRAFHDALPLPCFSYHATHHERNKPESSFFIVTELNDIGLKLRCGAHTRCGEYEPCAVVTVGIFKAALRCGIQQERFKMKWPTFNLQLLFINLPSLM